MPRFDRTILALLLLIGGVLGVIAYGRASAGVADAKTVTAQPTDAHEHHEQAEGEREEPSRFSLADLTTIWRDQTGAERTLTGRPDDRRLAVVTMLYTNCTVSCPRLIADLKRIEGALSEAQREQVEFIVVSLDPARDTPAKLAAFAKDMRADEKRWTFLNGSDAAVREVASVLRVRYVTESNGEISHTNRIVVLDAANEPIHWQAGLGSGVPGTVGAIEAELKRAERHTAKTAATSHARDH
ncbi:MAG: SCO family protein [Gemmatimonadaceae bacterium]